jgi:ABC-type nitrate/sulfonate/bicarbonate transport system permease component
VLSFFLVALLFVGLLTVVVRLAGFGVRKELPRARELLLTGVFVGLVLVAWWLLTRGERYEDRLVNVTILPSPIEMLKAFGPLHGPGIGAQCAHFDRAHLAGVHHGGNGGGAFGSLHGHLPPIASFFRPVTLVGSYVPTVVFIPLSIAFGLARRKSRKSSFCSSSILSRCCRW